MPLATDAYGRPIGIGPVGRAADHAVVAMNDNKDIAVAFHSSRGGLRQVELAYYDYQNVGGVESWVYADTILLGGIEWSPIAGLPQVGVRCERPDLIAVRDKFFVVWTRRYEHDQGYASQDDGPAVLECAWVERSLGTPNKLQPYPDYYSSSFPGLGFELDAHVVAAGSRDYLVRECSGVADAVVLKDASHSTDEYLVAVAYPHQTMFSAGGSDNRQFDMRLMTCKLDMSGPTPVISKGPTDVELRNQIHFNGPSSSGSNSSAGLILPDLAPSSLDNSFWMVAEAQSMTSGLPDGRIRLDYWEQDTSGSWSSPFGTTYKSPAGGTPYVRRRPNVSSYPLASSPQGEQMVSVSFNKADPDPLGPDQTTQVIYKSLVWQNGSTIVHPVIVTDIVGTHSAWPNDVAFSDGKTVPLRGRDSPFIRRCFADRTPATGGPPCDIMMYDDVTEMMTSIDSVAPPNTGGVGRPSAAYVYDSSAAQPDYVALCWEKHLLSGDPLRIWLAVE